MNIYELHNRLVKRASAESYDRNTAFAADKSYNWIGDHMRQKLQEPNKNTAPADKPRGGFHMPEPEYTNPIQEHFRKMFPKQRVDNKKDSKPKPDNSPQLLPYHPNQDQPPRQLLPYRPGQDEPRLQLL